MNLHFESFRENFKISDKRSCSPDTLDAKNVPRSLVELLELFRGATFERGIYRVACPHEIHEITKEAKRMFPEVGDRITCFSYDWLGRIFALDASRHKNDEPLILMLEPGSGKAYNVPWDLYDFHNVELVEHPEDALAIDFFREWSAVSMCNLSFDQCAGYRIPLFLGGKDDLENLEIEDVKVYWGLCAQLRLQSMQLPSGTNIGRVTVEDDERTHKPL